LPDPTTLATTDDLGLLVGDDNIDDDRAQLLVELATGAIQAECQQHLLLVTDDEVDLDGTFDPELWLPERPVISVSEVLINTFVLAAGTWILSPTGQLYRGPLLTINGPDWDWFDLSGGPLGVNAWGGPSSKVHVKYTHGFAVPPNDLRALCLELARRGLQNPEVLVREQIGNYSYDIAAAAVAAGMELTDPQKKICGRYRRDLMSLKTSG
jgi:hypothetical protein